MSPLKSLIPFALLLGTVSAATSQELGAFAAAGRSSDSELGNPNGYGIRASWFPIRYLGLRFDYARYGSRATWIGSTCDAYDIVHGCSGRVTERLENEYEMSALEYSVVVPIRLYGWRVEGSIGVAKVDDEYEVRGLETGRILARSGGDRSLEYGVDDLFDLLGRDSNARLFAFGVSREGIRSWPVVVGLEWRRKTIDEYGGALDVLYWPSWYLDEFRVEEVRLHAGWRF